MRLSKRIYKIAELINEGSTVADIGTDHGYVPMLLMKEGKSPRVIMSDISSDSLSKAVETFKLTGLKSKVPDSDFRVGDGLATLEAGEVDTVIIAGLGGHTIAEILAFDEAKAKSFKRLVLQPRKHSGTLRYYLCTHGWEIESENLAKEGKFACEIITAVPLKEGQGLHAASSGIPSENDIRWKYPRELIEADLDLAVERISWKIGSLTDQLDSLSLSSDDVTDLTESLKCDREYLIDLIGCSESSKAE